MVQETINKDNLLKLLNNIREGREHLLKEKDIQQSLKRYLVFSGQVVILDIIIDIIENGDEGINKYANFYMPKRSKY